MNEEEFINEMRELDPFWTEGFVPLEVVYEHFKVVVHEMDRLEDIEDDRAQMQAYIDELKEQIDELKKGDRVR